MAIKQNYRGEPSSWIKDAASNAGLTYDFHALNMPFQTPP
uniref:Uncharacterized protein n=1 Tax=Rhizophora mucronata TaxID=61149 RepID=A0A2P2PS02_RHIMU